MSEASRFKFRVWLTDIGSALCLAARLLVLQIPKTFGALGKEIALRQERTDEQWALVFAHLRLRLWTRHVSYLFRRGAVKQAWAAHSEGVSLWEQRVATLAAYGRGGVPAARFEKES